MYKNAYSRGVSNELSKMIRKNLKYSGEQGFNFDGSMMGMGVHSNANNCECMESPCRCYKGEDSTMSGGSGYAAGTRLDSGFERTIGAGVALYKKGKGQIAGMPPVENYNEYPQIAVAGDGDLVAEAKVKRVVGGRKKGKGTKELLDDVKKYDLNRIKNKDLVMDDVKKFDLNKIKSYIGLAKPEKMYNQVELARLPKKNVDKVVERNQMQGIVGGGMSGGDGRKKRAELVKKIMKEKGLKMIEASKYIAEKGLYKK